MKEHLDSFLRALIPFWFLIFERSIFQTEGKVYLLIPGEFRPMADTLDFHFEYEEDFRGMSHTFKLKDDLEHEFECDLFGDRGDMTQHGNFFQTIQLPMDYFYQQFSNVTPEDMTATVFANGQAETFSLQFELIHPNISAELFDLSIDIYGGDIFYGSAVHFMKDSGIPTVSSSEQISIKLSYFDHSKYDYRMELYRIDYYAENLCPTHNLGGKIDLETYIGLTALQKCEVDMKGPWLIVQAFSMPFGYIRVTMVILHPINGEFRIHVCIL
ncbi:hypothetical protein ElyMa_000122200 [Elysia marginata]|uniref:Uncharacterized protein n=1 Tax=Elysia marginata TaxID=1093978 RepID=A0AAV4EMM5_9GAST|nr:hypothetical protein ElyMa_000122200 [Elysia marginata]